MKTNTLEELQSRHAQEIRNLKRKEAVFPLLPIAPQNLCAHNGKPESCSVSYEVNTLPEALDIYRAFLPSIVDCEAWRSGCVSVAPAEMTDESKRGTLEFTAHAEVVLTGYGERSQYQDQEVHFFARAGGEWLRVSVKIKKAWQPIAYWNQGSRREPGSLVVRYPSLGEDNRLGWWSPEGCYRKSYYWADTHNFLASMGHESDRLAKKEGTP